MLSFFNVNFYFCTCLRTNNMSRVNLTRTVPEGPKSEHKTRVKIYINQLRTFFFCSVSQTVSQWELVRRAAKIHLKLEQHHGAESVLIDAACIIIKYYIISEAEHLHIYLRPSYECIFKNSILKPNLIQTSVLSPFQEKSPSYYITLKNNFNVHPVKNKETNDEAEKHDCCSQIMIFRIHICHICFVSL